MERGVQKYLSLLGIIWICKDDFDTPSHHRSFSQLSFCTYFCNPYRDAPVEFQVCRRYATMLRTMGNNSNRRLLYIFMCQCGTKDSSSIVGRNKSHVRQLHRNIDGSVLKKIPFEPNTDYSLSAATSAGTGSVQAQGQCRHRVSAGTGSVQAQGQHRVGVIAGSVQAHLPPETEEEAHSIANTSTSSHSNHYK